MMVTLRCLASAFKPPVNLSTMLVFQLSILRISISGCENLTPWSAMSAASLMMCAVCNSAFDGIQPTFKQTPPILAWRSIITTCLPKSAARNAAV